MVKIVPTECLKCGSLTTACLEGCYGCSDVKKEYVTLEYVKQEAKIGVNDLIIDILKGKTDFSSLRGDSRRRLIGGME